MQLSKPGTRNGIKSLIWVFIKGKTVVVFAITKGTMGGGVVTVLN